MPKLLLPLLSLMLFGSCVTYQYFTVDSSQLTKNTQQSFVMDNDTLQLSYSFTGNGGPLTITVLNKTDQPLLIDWNRSALICNDQSYPLAQTNSTFTATTTGGHTGVTALAGTVIVNPGTELVPAKTKATRLTIGLDQTIAPGRMVVPDTASKQLSQAPDGSQISYKAVSTDEKSSPLKLRSYITFRIGQGNGTEFVESNTFYVVKMMETRYAPNNFYLYQPTGDQFYFMLQNQKVITSSGTLLPPSARQR